MAQHTYPPDEQFRFSLLKSMYDPAIQMYRDDQIVIVRERKPKASIHYLMLPHEAIDTARDLRPHHIPLLRHMLQKGNEFADEFVRPHTHYPVILGFHTIATFIRLHMHIISTDFNGPGGETSGDYREFVHRELWVEPDRAIYLLEREGRIPVNEELCRSIKLSPTEPMPCYFCKERFIYIPKLQKHLMTHEEELHRKDQAFKTDCRYCRPVPMFFKRNKRLFLSAAVAGMVVSGASIVSKMF
ncbi:aprataxin-like [Paramacrobiotus metropolitanus]|uniref:aprataxin-like n=1 Tax=Paramacrobiotus metropolitanus TaxID=2943436 RepID=UPI0024463AF0|nr:aprataxin-like [Paramacrobiotus metropolitanus]